MWSVDVVAQLGALRCHLDPIRCAARDFIEAEDYAMVYARMLGFRVYSVQAVAV